MGSRFFESTYGYKITLSGTLNKDVVASKPSKNQENHDDLEGVIASKALSSLVTCTLPLKDLLRVRPWIWRKMAKELSLPETNQELKPVPPQSKPVEPKLEHVSINKMSKKMGSLEGNTTQPVEHENVVYMAILDSGARMSVVTKSIWEKWGKLTVRSTQMNLQLADGRLKNPIRIWENVALTTCGIQYIQSFVVVDLGKEANYKLILGRPFMGQFSMV